MADNHGNTPAAWTAVLLALVGFVVGSIGLMLDPLNFVIFWIGVAIVALSGVAFIVLARMGYNTENH